MHTIEHFRQQKDHFFKIDPHSPLTDEQQDSFEGLHYYPVDETLDFVITPEEFDDKQEIMMATSTGSQQQYYRWGRITFEVDGDTAELTVYQAVGSGGFFLPFVDATSGDETYGAGRYLEIEPEADGTMHVNFNMAYNPYCAYNELYSCPIPPAENRLNVPIRAGEKNFK